ncbi:CRAL-TRIO domain-containing protein [Umbelopsis sp. AD052]|nr:CRAL-TRIO domain-containing protein [Umbelopsis sp. AD052]
MNILLTKSSLLNENYNTYSNAIDSLNAALHRELPLLAHDLTLDSMQVSAVHDYINDRVTLFRFLKRCEFVVPSALALMLDTIQWRLREKVDSFTWDRLPSELQQSGIVFFRNYDKLNRPIGFVRLRQLPKFSQGSLIDNIKPLVIYVMETARKMTLDLTKQRELDGMQCPLTSQMAVVIDIKNAPFLPLDAELPGVLMDIMDNRYPGFVGSVYILNYGWMYAGIWQMVKLLLSEDAKSRISFPSTAEVLNFISSESLLSDLGGADDYEWSLESDLIAQKYAMKSTLDNLSSKHISIEQPPSPVPSPPRLARTNSNESIVSSDVFYDAMSESRPRSSSLMSNSSVYLSPRSMSVSSSAYGTPTIGSPYLFPIAARAYDSIPPAITPSAVSRPYTGLHTGLAFLTSLFTRVNPNVHQTHPNGAIPPFILEERLHILQEQDLPHFELLPDASNLVQFEEDQRKIQSAIISRTARFPNLLSPSHPQSPYVTHPFSSQLIRAERRITRTVRKAFRMTFKFNGAFYWVVLYLLLRGGLEDVAKATTETLVQVVVGGSSASAGSSISLKRGVILGSAGAAVAGLIGMSIGSGY